MSKPDQNQSEAESGRREANSLPTRRTLSRPPHLPPPTNSDPQASRDWLNAKREQMANRSTQPAAPPVTPRPSVKRISPPEREPNPSGYMPPSMRGSSPLSGLLHNVVGGMDSSTKIQESLALAYWPRAVGVQGAAATEVDTVRDGVLFVRTKSSVWSHELTLHKPKLLQNLNRMLGGKVLHDIIFRAQGITRQEKIVEVDTPGAEELAAVVLEPEEKAELRVRLRQLISIPDDRIRHAIAVRLTNEAKLQHWRLERGWRLCLRCHVPHKTDADTCPQCRLNR